MKLIHCKSTVVPFKKKKKKKLRQKKIKNNDLFQIYKAYLAGFSIYTSFMQSNTEVTLSTLLRRQ